MAVTTWDSRSVDMKPRRNDCPGVLIEMAMVGLYAMPKQRTEFRIVGQYFNGLIVIPLLITGVNSDNLHSCSIYK